MVKPRFPAFNADVITATLQANNMEINSSPSILFFAKHMSYSKKRAETMKAHSNNDKTLDELGAFVRFGILVKITFI